MDRVTRTLIYKLFMGAEDVSWCRCWSLTWYVWNAMAANGIPKLWDLCLKICLAFRNWTSIPGCSSNGCWELRCVFAATENVSTPTISIWSSQSTDELRICAALEQIIKAGLINTDVKLSCGARGNCQNSAKTQKTKKCLAIWQPGANSLSLFIIITLFFPPSFVMSILPTSGTCNTLCWPLYGVDWWHMGNRLFLPDLGHMLTTALVHVSQKEAKNRTDLHVTVLGDILRSHGQKRHHFAKNLFVVHIHLAQTLEVSEWSLFWLKLKLFIHFLLTLIKSYFSHY